MCTGLADGVKFEAFEACQGIFFKEIKLPKLKAFLVSRSFTPLSPYIRLHGVVFGQTIIKLLVRNNGVFQKWAKLFMNRNSLYLFMQVP
jgi:hypothetical protein